MVHHVHGAPESLRGFYLITLRGRVAKLINLQILKQVLIHPVDVL